MRLISKLQIAVASLILCSGVFAISVDAAGASVTGSRISGGIRNQPTQEPTFNWAGYVQDGTAGEFTAIKDKWKVPTVSNTQKKATKDYYAQQIVGIGGYGSDSTLIEAGTETDYINGKAVYEAFAEDSSMGESVFPGITIHPGDVVTALVEEYTTNDWEMAVTDVTTGVTGDLNTGYSSSGESAEVVLDRPCLSGDCYVSAINYAQLAKTSDVTFPVGKINTAPPGEITWVPLLSSVSGSTPYHLFMKNYHMDKIIACASNPSSNNEGFTAAYGPFEPPPPSK